MKQEFVSVVEAILFLSSEDKHKLFQLLDEEIAQVEKLNENPAIQAEVQEARTGYQIGDYLTFNEYIAHRSETALRATESLFLN